MILRERSLNDFRLKATIRPKVIGHTKPNQKEANKETEIYIKKRRKIHN